MSAHLRAVEGMESEVAFVCYINTQQVIQPVPMAFQVTRCWTL